jgi:hypothetical protein
MYTNLTRSSIWPTMSRSVVDFALQRHRLRHTDPNKTIVIVVLGVRTIAMQSSRAKTWNILGKLGHLGCKADPCAVTVSTMSSLTTLPEAESSA